MKILHVCVSGPYTDGWNYQENVLTKCHANMGHSVAILASQYKWGKKGKIEFSSENLYTNSNGVRVYRLPIKNEKDIFFRYKRFIGFYNTICEFSPDVIFVHNLQFLDIDQIVEYAKKNNVTIYVDNHADFTNSARSTIAKLFYKIVWRHYAKKIEPYTRKFYGVLPARVDFLKNVYGLPEKKCELLVMGAEDEKIQEAQESNARQTTREKYGIKQSDFLIMTGGKIDAWKNQILLLMDAVKKIDNPNIKLIVFGSVAPELIDEINSRIDFPKIQYIGWIEPNESYKTWVAADLVVFPGRHSVFWEQVAGMGIPMICKFWNGTSHVDVGGNVEFLYEDNIEEITNKITLLTENNLKYAQMVHIARTYGMKFFSYNKIASKAIEHD